LRNPRGEGKGGCIFSALLAAAAIYVGYHFVVPYYHYSAFEGRLSEMMTYYRNQSADAIQKAVIDTGKEYGLSLKPEQVRVQVVMRHNRIVIDVEYQRQVKLPFYTHTLTFKPHLTGSAY
jgi:hypothetical protein